MSRILIWCTLFALPFKLFSGWAAPVTISVADKKSEIPELAKGGADNASVICIWGAYDGSHHTPHVAHFNGSWSIPQTLDSVELNPIIPQIAMDSSGNAFALWQDAFNAFKTCYFNGLAWDASPTIHTHFSARQARILLGMSSGGSAIACGTTNFPSSICSFVFDGTSWSAPALSATVAFSPNSISINDSQQAMYVGTKVRHPYAQILNSGSWSNDIALRISGSWFNNIAKTYDDDTGLTINQHDSHEATLSTQSVATEITHSFFSPINCAAISSTNALLVSATDSTTYDGASWSPPETRLIAGISPAPVQYPPYGREPQALPGVDTNASGEAMAAWVRMDDITEEHFVRIARYNGTSWETPVTVSVAADEKPCFPRVVIDDNGDAIAVWQSVINGIDTIRAAHYTP